MSILQYLSSRFKIRTYLCFLAGKKSFEGKLHGEIIHRLPLSQKIESFFFKSYWFSSEREIWFISCTTSYRIQDPAVWRNKNSKFKTYLVRYAGITDLVLQRLMLWKNLTVSLVTLKIIVNYILLETTPSCNLRIQHSFFSFSIFRQIRNGNWHDAIFDCIVFWASTANSWRMSSQIQLINTSDDRSHIHTIS